MQKSELVNLIKKYYLEGLCPAVKWTVNEKNLKIDCVTEDKSLLVSLDANLELDNGEFGIFDTNSLMTLLGALDEQIEVDFHYEKNTLTGLKLKDKVVDATFMLADLSILPESKTLKNVPEPDVKIELKKELVDRFIKSRKSLSDSKLVAFLPTSDSVDVVINFAEHNTNRITLNFPATVTNQFDLIAFNVDGLAKVLAANLDFREGSVSISEAGLMVVHFKGEDYESKYYLKKVEIS